MTCQDVQQRLYDFLDGALDSTTSDGIQDHLHTCRHCRHEVAALQASKTGCVPCCVTSPYLQPYGHVLRLIWSTKAVLPLQQRGDACCVHG
jgi:predicted anti-sigma-YlaC factor YlaD